MESKCGIREFGTVVHTASATDRPVVLVVCEHASNRIPGFLNNLGLEPDVLNSHVAWDPGALPLAKEIANRMSAALIYGGVSRLVYDCNRGPDAPDAMPAKSEEYTIPANAALTPDERNLRIDQVYRPFSQALSGEIEKYRDSLRLMVTVHSFTPVYYGLPRSVEVGLLHGVDDRFANAMIGSCAGVQPFVTALNEPYSAADGVAHTLDVHALPNGLLNVMIEVRNDLIQNAEQQNAMADYLVPWIEDTLKSFPAGPSK